MPPMSGPLEHDDTSQVPPTRVRAHPRWFLIALGMMVVLFAAAMFGRDRIRAHWWSYRLAGAEDTPSQSYYLGALSAVGSSARGAVERLAVSEEPQLRAMAVAVLTSTTETWSVEILGRLLNDTDVDVRESAALALGFMRTDPARAVLCQAVEADVGAAAAVYALGRTGGAAARDLICDVPASHPSPAVRAQAVETLADMIRMDEAGPAPSDARVNSACDPWLRLAGALADDGAFTGLLAIEREVEGAMAFASSGHPLGAVSATSRPVEGVRTVGRVAAKQLSALTGDAIVPVVELSPGRQAELADRCRGAYLRRGEAAGGPVAPRHAEKPASAPVGSSDTPQDQRQ